MVFWQPERVCHNKLSLLVLEIYFLWKLKMCQHWTSMKFSWFIKDFFFFYPSPFSQQYLEKIRVSPLAIRFFFKDTIKSALERVTNYSSYVNIAIIFIIIWTCGSCFHHPYSRLANLFLKWTARARFWLCRTVAGLEEFRDSGPCFGAAEAGLWLESPSLESTFGGAWPQCNQYDAAVLVTGPDPRFL